MKKIAFAYLAYIALVACSGEAPAVDDSEPEDTPDTASASVTFPDSLAPFGNGYPNEGDPCRRLGEGSATVDWLDDSATLVGCPSADAAAALGGSLMGEVEGITVISIPSANANEGMPETPMQAPVTQSAEQVDGIEMRRVSFASGENSARVKGSITGSQIIDYVLNVREGQPMNVSMASQNPQAYFNIMEPGETNVATFIGSTSGNQFEGVAKESGDYRIRVYLMRAAARRDETADYGLEMIVG